MDCGFCVPEEGPLCPVCLVQVWQTYQEALVDPFTFWPKRLAALLKKPSWRQTYMDVQETNQKPLDCAAVIDGRSQAKVACFGSILWESRAQGLVRMWIIDQEKLARLNVEDPPVWYQIGEAFRLITLGILHPTELEATLRV